MTATPARPRRLLIVCHTGEVSGAEFVLLDIARHYGGRCEVLLFADGPLADRLARDGIRYSVLPAGRSVSGVRREAGRLRALLAAPAVVMLAWRLARMSRRDDVLYPNSQKAAVVTLLVAWLLRRELVWHLHDILSPEHFAPLQRWLMARLANRGARRVITVSRAARDAFIASGGDPDRAVVIYNGFDQARFARSDDADGRAAVRHQLGVGAAPLLGVFGRIAGWKGQHILLRALPDMPGVHVLVVGDTLFNEAATLVQLKALADELGVADRVHWLGHRDDVPGLMQVVDVVLHTSIAPDPCPRVIVEGMLSARPVIATDCGGAPELLGDESRAVVPPGDPTRLAAAVNAILHLSPQERAACGAHHRARAQAMFSLDAFLAGVSATVALDAPA